MQKFTFTWTTIRLQVVLVLLVLISSSNLQCGMCARTLIKRNQLKGMQGVPVLGRGYSTSTNSFQSSCINVNGTISSSAYNFNYFITDFTESIDYRKILGKSQLMNTFSYERVRAAVFDAAKTKDTSLFPNKRYHIIATMEVQGISTGLSETQSYMTNEAIKLLNDQDFVNFFMTCGPKYVRSIHKAQEVTAIFAFDAPDLSTAQMFGKVLTTFLKGIKPNTNDIQIINLPIELIDQVNRDILTTLSIEILGYGLSLNKVGTETLVATSLEEFNRVMEYAVNSMGKKSLDHHDTQPGMIHAITVVPWVDNADFLQTAGVDYATIELNVPYSLQEDVIVNEDGTTICYDSDLVSDDFGKCCEASEILTRDEIGQNLTNTRCQSVNHPSPAEITKHMDSNAEFVIRLSSIVKKKNEAISTLGQCVSTLRAFPKRFDYFFLKSIDEARYDTEIETSFTVKEMKSALDPNGDMGLLSLVGTENDEFFEMFYQPCLSALYGMNLGYDKETSSKFFMVDAWFNYEECTRSRCLEHGSAWDRKNGNGCVDGILKRNSLVDPTVYPTPATDDLHCAPYLDTTTGEEVCKHQPDTEVINQFELCRRKLFDDNAKPVAISLSYLIDYFCMPQLAVNVDQADAVKMDNVDLKWIICSTGVEFPSCDATYPQSLRDGFCDGGVYNTELCGWDGEDCIDYNANHPDCSVTYPYLLGNGFCNGHDYDTEECGYDGGDCEDFKRLFPSCSVEHPFLVGNGFCDGDEYNKAECGYDGGDCDLVNA